MIGGVGTIIVGSVDSFVQSISSSFSDPPSDLVSDVTLTCSAGVSIRGLLIPARSGLIGDTASRDEFDVWDSSFA